MLKRFKTDTIKIKVKIEFATVNFKITKVCVQLKYEYALRIIWWTTVIKKQYKTLLEIRIPSEKGEEKSS